jgi:hypothetical protein
MKMLGGRPDGAGQSSGVTAAAPEGPEGDADDDVPF